MRETGGGQEFSRRRFLRKFGGAGFDRHRILKGTGDGRYRPPPKSLRIRRCRICRRRFLREDGNCARSTKAVVSAIHFSYPRFRQPGFPPWRPMSGTRHRAPCSGKREKPCFTPIFLFFAVLKLTSVHPASRAAATNVFTD